MMLCFGLIGIFLISVIITYIIFRWASCGLYKMFENWMDVAFYAIVTIGIFLGLCILVAALIGGISGEWDVIPEHSPILMPMNIGGTTIMLPM